MFNFSVSPVVANCIFTENTADGLGGGMYNYLSSPIVTDCTFAGNAAESYLYDRGRSRFRSGGSGGGMYSYESSPTITNCVFVDNSAYADGGGMFTGYHSSCTITNCVFTRNSSIEWRGGGMVNYESSATITNCTITGNRADVGGDEWWNVRSTLSVTNCIFWSDAPLSGPISVVASDIQGEPEGPGTNNADPMFVDASAADLRLRAESPCVDSGTREGAPARDILGVPRPQGGGVDMGAYELAVEGNDADDDDLPDWVETDTGVYVDQTDTGTDPTNPDTDGDGYTDGAEVTAGTDPLDPTSHPAEPTTAQPRTGARGGSGGPECFIATAAYGTPMAEEVGILSDFRDRYLLTNRVGAAFVRTYYRLSPPLARFIAKHEPFRVAVRAVLTPIVAIAKLFMRFPLSMVALLLSGGGIAQYFRDRHRISP